MTAEPETVTDPEQHLEEIVLEYLQAVDAGRTPDPQEVLDRHPEVAAELRAFFADQERLDQLVSPLRARPPAAPCAGKRPGSFGDYEVLEEIGRGGMGVVYKARQKGLDRIVAVKMIRTPHTQDATLRARFQAEARAVAQLDHPNIVRVFESGEHDGRPYFVLEYVAGGSLARARRGGPWSPRAAAALVATLADAMAYAHQQGIVHRDLKPANILLQNDERGTMNAERKTNDSGSFIVHHSSFIVPRITDFGLAKQVQAQAEELTASGVCLGTPAFMAPEQAAGRTDASGPSADIFGLGAILYDLLTGRPPFQGKTVPEVVEQARQGRVIPPRQLIARVPRALERICLKALAADPQQRYTTAADLGHDLRRYLRRRRRLALAAGALTGLLLLGLTAWLLVRPGPATSPPAAPPPLSGELIARLWTPGGQTKRGLRVDEPGALPARNRDWIRLEAQLNQPAYIYLLWLDGQGDVTPLYPWNDRKIVHDLAAPPPARPPQEVVISPTTTDVGAAQQGWPLDEKSGLETVLLLTRRTPLPADVKLAQVVGKLPPVRLRHPFEVAVRGFDPGQPVDFLNVGENRGIQKEAAAIDDPLLQLMGRLREHFEMIRAVRFAHQGN